MMIILCASAKNIALLASKYHILSIISFVDGIDAECEIVLTSVDTR